MSPERRPLSWVLSSVPPPGTPWASPELLAPAQRSLFQLGECWAAGQGGGAHRGADWTVMGREGVQSLHRLGPDQQG